MKQLAFLLSLITIVTHSVAQTYNSEIEAANEGDTRAQWMIGNFFEKGTGGVEKNDSSAYIWYKRSADGGYAKSQISLAYFYENGLIVAQDYRQAFLLYKQAAEQGERSAQYNLGVFYELGRGVAKDPTQAQVWYQKAADNGSNNAKKALTRIEKKLPNSVETPVQVSKPVTPMVRVNNYALSGAGTKLEKKQTFDLTIYLENQDLGPAEDVTAQIIVPDGVMELDETSYSFATINGKETKALTSSFIIPNSYSGTSIPLELKVHEKYGRFAENWKTELMIGQSFTLGPSDIDTDVPQTDIYQSNTFALIIAEENYRREVSVPFAINDGKLFREYCKKTLGIPEKNIIYGPDITKSELSYSLRNLKDLVRLSPNPEESKILFYYAGHGIPDERNHTAHLLLIDGFGNAPESGISLHQLYQDLASTDAKSVSVFLDACFSGHKRDGGMIEAARGVVIVDDEEDIPENMVVFAAAQDDESAYSYQNQQHGLFTYYLLKKLKETSGDVTYGELSRYVTNEVLRTSIQTNNKRQTPSVDSSISGWEKWKLK